MPPFLWPPPVGLDWELFKRGPVVRYEDSETLSNDLGWLEAHQYRVVRLSSALWIDHGVMHDELKSKLGFPDYYGRNLDALNDSLREVETEPSAGLILVLLDFDIFWAVDSQYAWKVLDIFAKGQRWHLLFGRRLLVILQSKMATGAIPPVGGSSALLNLGEWLLEFRDTRERKDIQP